MFKDCLSLPLRRSILLGAAAPVLLNLGVARAEDTSAAPILQYFESTYATLEARMSDVFQAGYGTVYTPPPGRADSGGQSVGYDQYNRFDLGSANNPTLYGTEAGLKAAVAAAHAAGLDYGIDFVMNHAGYSGTGTAAQNAAFQQAGGYPGLVTTLQSTNPGAPGYNTLGYNAIDGDFHGAYAGTEESQRLAGLIDIDHTTNWQLIRNPTQVDSRNIAAGTVTNQIDPNNARFYTDTSGAAGVKYVYDPKTGEQNIPIYNFNTASPMAGVATPENVTGYLMRNAQWLVQTIGIDTFRLDATKNMEPFVLNYFDRAVYRASTRTLLDGSQKNVFSFGEAYTSDKAYLQTLIRKDINPNNPGTVGGNRDTLDFPLFFSLKSNLSNNGLSNDWRNVVGSSLDYADDGLMNGSIGVKFAASADDFGADLSNTSYAYTLMTPGNAIVYDNAKQFGNGRDFPKSGRADALGGAYGDQITKLVNIRDVYAQGNFTPRFLTKESYAFERNRQSLTLLSNRSDNVYDHEAIGVNFAYGTNLIELTGNAAKFGAPQVLTVTNDYFNGPSYVNAQFLPNNGGDHGYLVYGLQAPQGAIALSNVSQTLAGTASPTLTGTADQKSYQNATTRLSNIDVITGNSFGVNLATNAVSLLGSIRDKNADGDNALVKVDGGIDLNHNGHVDYTTPGNVAYGFEEFTGTHTPGFTAASGNGTYAQTIDTTGLSEGYHYLTVRAFRHRDDGGPAVYQDFKDTIYVDRLKPLSSVDSFHTFGTDVGNNDLWIKSDDQTANSIRVFLNLPANLTDAQILTMVNNGQGSTDQIDRNLFKTGFFGVPNGNNTVTVVSYEITGNHNVQRYTGINPTNHLGAGIGDLNHDGAIAAGDLTGTTYGFEHFLYARNSEFNPSADVNGDGLIDNRDLFALDTTLATAPAPAKAALRQVELTRGNINGQYGTDAYDIDALYRKRGETGENWFDDLNVDGNVDQLDVDVLVRQVLKTEYGDVNLDGRVDINDLRILAAHYEQANQVWATADLTGDTLVNELDLNLMGQYFNFGVPADQQTTFAQAESIVGVPEPAALATLCIGSMCVLRRKTRHAETVAF